MQLTYKIKLGLIILGAGFIAWHPPLLDFTTHATHNNQSTLQVDRLDVGLGTGDDTGLTIFGNGRYVVDYDNQSSASSPAIQVDSSRGGIKMIGKYYGIKAENRYDTSSNKYGRTAIIGQVNAPDPSGEDMARGYVGYLEDTLPNILLGPGPFSIGPTTGGPGPSFTLSNPGYSGFPTLSPLGGGTLWAFFTEEPSRFNDVAIGGVISSSDDEIEFNTSSEPADVFFEDIVLSSNGTNVITTGHLALDVNDYIQDLNSSPSSLEVYDPSIHDSPTQYGVLSTDADDYLLNDARSMIFTVVGSDIVSGRSYSDYEVAFAYCPSGTVRIACDGWVEGGVLANGIAPYRGSAPLSSAQACISYARIKGPPNPVNAFLYVQATCMASELPAN